MFEFYDRISKKTLTEQEATKVALNHLRTIDAKSTDRLISTDEKCSLLFDTDGYIYIEDSCGNHIEAGKISTIGIRTSDRTVGLDSLVSEIDKKYLIAPDSKFFSSDVSTDEQYGRRCVAALAVYEWTLIYNKCFDLKHEDDVSYTDFVDLTIEAETAIEKLLQYGEGE
jgi:hypothetical protein